MPFYNVPFTYNMRDFFTAPPGQTHTPDGTRLHGAHLAMDHDEHGRPMPPINKLIEQMSIFLKDEDIHRDENFKPKLEECRTFIRSIKFGNRAGKHYSAALVAEIELKIAVHDKWIREAEKVAEVDFDDDQHEVPLHGAGGRLMPRHWKPPFGVMAEEMADLETISAAGWPSSPWEAKSHLVNSGLPEEERMNLEYYDNLESLMQSGERGSSGPWYWHHKVAHVNADIDVVARAKLAEADTTWLATGDRLQERDFKKIKPYLWNRMPTDYLQPFLPPSAETLIEHWHGTYEKLSELLSGLCAVQMKAPRPIVTAVINYLMERSNQLNLEDRQAVASQNAEHLQNMYLCVGDYDESEYEYLAVLLEEARVDRPRNWVFHGQEASFVQRVEKMLEDKVSWFPDALGRPAEVETVIYEAVWKSQPPLKQLSEEECKRCLFRMGEDGRIQLFGDWQTASYAQLAVGRPTPNDFPEDRQNLSKDIDEWLDMAERCLKAYRRLSMNMRQMDQDPLYMKNVVIPDFANNLQARIRLWEMKVGYRALAELWIDLARPLAVPAERMKLGLQRARELLQRKLLEEEAAMGSLELQTPRESINIPGQPPWR